MSATKKNKQTIVNGPAKQGAASTAIAKKSFEELNNKWIWMGMAFLLAFILRSWNAGKVSLWFDEFLHVIPAADFVKGKGLEHIDGLNGVFTTWIQIVAMAIGGVNEGSARIAMAFFGALTIIPLYFLAQKLFKDYRVSLLAVLFFSVSLYSVYWGRTVRNYASFLPFYLYLHLFMLSFFEKGIALKNHFKLQSKPDLNLPNVGLFLLVFLLSVLNHNLTLFLFFGWVFYGTIVWILNLKHKDKKWWNRYTLFVPFMFSFGLFFTSFGNQLAKSVLSVLLPPNIVTAVVPDLSRILFLWKENPYESFLVYFNAMEADTGKLYLLALAGLVMAFFKYKRSALYIFSHFIFLAFLLSFVFREPALSRYFYFILPFFFITASYALVWILDSFANFIKKAQLSGSRIGLLILVATTIAFTKPMQLKAFLSSIEHGQIVDRAISEWYYTNWKEPFAYVSNNIQEGDVVLTTVPNAARFYLGVDTAKLGWFRQMRYDGTQKKYVSNDPLGKPVSGYTTDEFIQTVQNHDRGWLIVDYYFYNVMTNDSARQYAIQNLDYHFSASTDGSVQVFSWDKSKPKKSPSSVFVELGKPQSGRFESPDFDFYFNPQAAGPSVEFVFEIEGLDVTGEAYIQINSMNYYPINKSTKGNNWGREMATATVPSGDMQNGQNKLKILYNPQVGETDIRPGFVVYQLAIR